MCVYLLYSIIFNGVVFQSSLEVLSTTSTRWNSSISTGEERTIVDRNIASTETSTLQRYINRIIFSKLFLLSAWLTQWTLLKPSLKLICSLRLTLVSCL